MADNLTTTTTTSTIPSGTVVATNDVSSVHYQKVKLTASATGSTEALTKATDAAHSNGEHIMPAGAVRDDALTTLTPADGDYTVFRVDSTGSQWVTLSAAAEVIGTTAHDAVDANAPIKVGHKAIAHGTNPTAVAAADRTDWYSNRAGVPFVMGGHPNVVTIEAAYTAAQTDTAIISVSAGTKIVVTQIQAACDNANTVDVGIRVGFAAANTPTTTGVVLTHPGIAAGSGISRGDGSGILGVGADAEDLRVTCEVPTTGSIRVLVSYYTIES